MNTAAYYVFLYTYACLTNDFCSNAIKNDEAFRKEVLKLWDLLWGPGAAAQSDAQSYAQSDAPVVIPRKFFELPSSRLTKEELAELKDWFTKARDYWGTLPDNHFEGEIEDKVARMIISVAIFGGSAKSISGVRALLNDSYCTNEKNRIHMDCIADFASAAEPVGRTPVGTPGGIPGGTPGGTPGASGVSGASGAPHGLLEKGFRVDQGYLNFKEEGTRICLIRGHYVPYYINHRGVFFVDMEFTIPTEHIEDAQEDRRRSLGNATPKKLPVFFLKSKIRQLGEECGLHSLMAILYNKIIGFNPFFIWHQEIVPGLDYKSFSKMRHWLTENGVDFTVLLRAQEYICYRIF